MISTTDISTAVSRVLTQYDVSEAYLFGSFAQGEQTPDSDIDLRLVCGNTMTLGTLYELSYELEMELGRKVDVVTNPPEHMRPAFRKSIEQDEVRIYEALQAGRGACECKPAAFPFQRTQPGDPPGHSRR